MALQQLLVVIRAANSIVALIFIRSFRTYPVLFAVVGMGAEPRSGVTQPPPSRPTTPLRPSSRSSVRSACFGQHGATLDAEGITQPAIVALQSQFSELADSISDLEANFMHLQLMHESLSRFNENFASFLYGLNMNAFSVDFPEVWSRPFLVCRHFNIETDIFFFCSIMLRGYLGPYSTLIQAC